MKQLQTLSKMSDWYWELNSIQHASTLFEKRLHALQSNPLPAARQPQVASLLHLVQQHRQQLEQIQSRLQAYSMSLLQQGKQQTAAETLDKEEEQLEKTITNEINDFSNVKNQYFSFIRQMLFPEGFHAN
ncbi:MAG: hypothetical protein ACK4E8_03445 [Lacibacter sp.]|jgi:exonuclease VII large subunit